MSRPNRLADALSLEGAEWRTLGDVGEFVRGGGLQKKDLHDHGVPAIHYGEIHTHYGTAAEHTRSFVAQELAEKLRKAHPGDLVIATTSEDDDALGKAVAWLGDTPAVVSSDAFIYRHSLVPKFVSYFFQSSKFHEQKKRAITGTKVRRISGDALTKIKVPVPPIAVQEEIVRVLDRLQALEAELALCLRAELTARSQQYDFYRDVLLADSPDRPSTLVRLGDVLSMRAGKFMSASDISRVQDAQHPYPCFGGNGLRGYVPKANHDGEYLLIGRQGALSGNVKRFSGSFYATEHAVVVTVGTDIHVDWLFHLLTQMNLNQYVSKGAQPGLAISTLNGLEIRVPAVEEQKRIGATLDKLETLVAGLSDALQFELDGRRKQYEHCRDDLFTFEEATT